jgi:hypothetical protein
MRQRTTLVVAQAKAVGAARVMGVVSLHRASHQTSPSAMSAGTVARWGIGHKEEGSLLIMTATLTRPEVSSTPRSMVEVISSRVEIELKEEKVYAHLDEKKECDAKTWVVDTGASNHMFGC